MPNGVGRVDATRVNVASATDGQLMPLYDLPGGHFRPFDRVERGQIVARLDDRPLVAELEALRSDAAALEAELVATQIETRLAQFDRQQEHLRESAELSYQVERHRLDLIGQQALVEETRLELQQVDAQLELLDLAATSGVGNSREAASLRASRDVLAALLATRTEAVQRAEENLRAAESRRSSFPELESADLAAAIEPIRQAVAAAESRAEEVSAQVDVQVIRSPISGTVSAVYSHPGQGVSAGDWILTIAADEADSITGYVPDFHRFRPTKGMRVGVRLRVPGSRMLDSVVQEVGSQWETMPAELLRDTQVPQVALPVRIAIPRGLAVRPGELVDLRFYGHSSSGGNQPSILSAIQVSGH
jgi:multidrug resistance efflux pump